MFSRRMHKRDIRVLMQIRSDAFSMPGGDTTQCFKTKEYLEKLGVKVDVSYELRPTLQNYDIIHLFQIEIGFHENYIRYKNAKKQNKPLVLSSIYWNANDRLQNAALDMGNRIYYTLPDGVLRKLISTVYNRRFKELVNFAYSKSWSSLDLKHLRAEVLRSCNLILPNSQLEVRVIMRDFGICDKSKFLVIPNAADKSFFHSSPHHFISKYGLQDFVLCAARIEQRKNQLSLIKALRQTNLKLVLIGGSQRSSALAYYKKCKKEADKDVLFINWINSEELASAYSAAKVHALPSWFETPGLASLEAGLTGCNVVTTDRGATKEYFKNYAWYCNPADVKSIRNAVVEAFIANTSKRLRQHILKNYTWERTAAKTLEAYNQVLMSVHN